MTISGPVDLVSGWYIRQGCESAASEAVLSLAAAGAEEPGTLVYLVHFSAGTPAGVAPTPAPLPTDPPNLLFYESYWDPEAFNDHLRGPAFQNFLSEHGALFRQVDGKPFSTVQFLERVAGFVRQPAAVTPAADVN